MSGWLAIIDRVKATPGEWVLVVEGAGTNRCRPLMGKGLKLKSKSVGKSPARFDIYAMAEEPTAPPYRIMTLVEMLSGSLMEQHGETAEAIVKASGWLEANPGRWFIVGEMESTGGTTVLQLGMDKETARRSGFEAEVRNNRVYARLASSEGLPLDVFVQKRVKRVDPLPKLERDVFNWSLSELREAALTAREWLFPGASYAAA